jgi:hypothetical protein
MLHHCSVYLQATAYFVLAKALLLQRRQREDQLQQQPTTAKKAITSTSFGDVHDLLNQSATLFQQADAVPDLVDVYYFQARLYHEQQQLQERNRCAQQFRVLSQTLTQNQNCRATLVSKGFNLHTLSVDTIQQLSRSIST